MPSVFGHVAVPVAVGLGLGGRVVSRPVILVGALLAILPDLDVLTFRLGIPYASPFGHRGFSHSLAFAAVMAALCTLLLRPARRRRPLATYGFLFGCAASHGLLDCLTDGGLGIALLWPFSDERWFAPIRTIAVSPLGVSRFFSAHGRAVLQSELIWVWLPAVMVGVLLWSWRSRRADWSQ